MMTFFASAAMVLVLAGNGESDTLPQTPLVDFSQTTAKGLEDFAGQAIFFEFFAYWCKPCGQVVPHVNELAEKYAEKGLVVIGVTTEGKKDTEKWIAEKGAKYPYAYDKKGDWSSQLGIDSIPRGVLVDVYGRVLWNGFPTELTEEKIEEALKGTLSYPISQWPKGANTAKAAFAKRQYGKSRQAAEAYAKSSAKEAPAVLKAVNQFIQERATTFASMMSSGDFLGAMELGAELKKDFAGLPELADVDKGLKEIQADKNATIVIKGQKEVRELKKEKIQKPEEAEAAIEKLDKIAEQYPETAAARDARTYKFILQNRLQSLKKRAEKKG